VQPRPGSRAVRVTPDGELALAELLGVQLGCAGAPRVADFRVPSAAQA
jgi:hypothetical protein